MLAGCDSDPGVYFFILGSADCANQVESDATRPNSGKSNDVYADCVFSHVLFLPRRFSVVLGGKQLVVYCTTVADQ